ncbi:MAG: DEAD/DEAH box helicase [Candidatus Lokiarchaeota archaeon]|nr:DEAD/DEAH box helicase [Candidatus Lokiarchaeota archaeon]
MKFGNKLELIFIPSSYWNEPLSGFKLISKGSDLPADSNFFVLWIPSNGSEEFLSEQITETFPSIPAKKLLSCSICLALPPLVTKNKSQQGISQVYYEITSCVGKIIPIGPAVKLLFQMEILEHIDRGVTHYSNSIKTWSFLTKLVFELLNKGQFIPILETNNNKGYRGKWNLLLKSQNDKDRLQTILKRASWSSFCIPINFIQINGSYKTNGLWHPSYLYSFFIDTIGDYLIRSTLNKMKFRTFNEFYSKELKKESSQDYRPGWDYKFLKSLTTKDSNFNVHSFHETILPTLIKNWTQSARGFTLKHGFVFNLELKYPKTPKSDWPLVFYVSFQDVAQNVPLHELWEENIQKKLENLNVMDNKGEFLEIILRALGTASKVFPPIKRVLLENLQDEITLTSSEVIDFLKYPKDLLIQSGFNVILPEVFRRDGKQRLSAKLIVRSNSSIKTEDGTFQSLPSVFDIHSMLDFKWEATIEGKKISDEEFNDLINSEDSLINMDGKWILVDPQSIADFKQSKMPEFENYMDVLKVGLLGKIQLQENGTEYDVIIEGDFNEIINKLQSVKSFEEIQCPSSFNGTLRHYQQDALTWMGNMTKFNFGLCLADDMGLGKTIQVIALLCYLKQQYPEKPGSVIIVCPTSILFNWHREIKKFAPDLEVMLHYGSSRIKDASDIPEILKPHKIILTSYGTLRNDIELLESINFSGIIVDESQNIKNFASQQSKAINKLKGQFKICLSGTPIENRLLELWSLFYFLNIGLLGKRKEFQNRYVIPIERFQNQDVIEKLRLIIAPFILRRVKSDKNVIKDLPDKNEMKIIVDLTESQVKLYKELVENTLKEINTLSSDKRKKRGVVLALLVKLKQICNHPSQYLKDDMKTFELDNNLKEFVAQSQKIERLIEMTDEVLVNGEKVLIFTQFTQMGDILKKVLEQKYNFEILYFHGGVQEKKRREIVDQFQSSDLESPPILILSLKAGGTGLNLTQGTTVIHIDRWWNPAVEDQATDRAYRIGQKSIVNVYKFITKGTIEEKIDALLEEKRELADKIVASTGESWISDLDDDKLRNLLNLGE